MGYRKTKVIYTITYEDHPGLEVRAHCPSLGFMRDSIGLVKLQGKTGKDLTPEDVKSLDDLFEGFEKCLISWNLEDGDGQPVPTTPEGMAAQEVPFIFAIIEGWMEGTMGVSGPLGVSSNGGEQSLEASIPMEPLSSVPPS